MPTRDFFFLLFGDGPNCSVIQTINQLNQFDRIDGIGRIDDFIQLFSIQIIESCWDVNQSLKIKCKFIGILRMRWIR